MVSDEFIKVLDELAKKLGVTIDWSQKNIMPYIQDLYSRYIQYEISTTMFWLVISILLIGISIACWCRYNQKLKNGVGEKYRNENGKLFAMLIAIWDGNKSGGVWSTIRKAQKAGKKIIYCPKEILSEE